MARGIEEIEGAIGEEVVRAEWPNTKAVNGRLESNFAHIALPETKYYWRTHAMRKGKGLR